MNNFVETLMIILLGVVALFGMFWWASDLNSSNIDLIDSQISSENILLTGNKLVVYLNEKPTGIQIGKVQTEIVCDDLPCFDEGIQILKSSNYQNKYEVRIDRVDDDIYLIQGFKRIKIYPTN